jgi:hypothetical protein
MDEFIDWYGYNDGVDYTAPQADYTAPAVDYTQFADQQGTADNTYQPNAGSSGAFQDGFGDTQFMPQQGATAPAQTPFWDYTFNTGAGTTAAMQGGFSDTTPGLPVNAAPAYAATFGAGAGAQPGITMGPSGSTQFATDAAPSQAGITGGMGGTTAAMQGGFGQTAQQPGLLQRANAGLKELGAWGKENAEVVKLGSGLVSALAGQRNASAARQQQGVADQQIQRELAMREQAQQSQMAALAENQRMAGISNQQAQQSFDEARSLYNPQEMAIRGMAQQTAATQRGVENLRKDLARRGLSQAAIDAEVRRARLGGSTAATTAYTKGLDTGRAAQQQALTSAKGLTSTVPGLSYTPSSSVADYYARQAETTKNQSALTSAQLQKLLEDYLGQPTKTVQDARTKAAGATAR